MEAETVGWNRIAILSFLAAFWIPNVTARADAPAPIRLWPGRAAEAVGDAENDTPWITPYLPARQRASGTAIVVCPGGGYANIAFEHEGVLVARWLNDIGVAAFVLKYRHRGTGYGHPAPLLDVQRAIQLVRCRTDQWQLKPDRIGVLGFSAGGHLASSAGTHFVPGNPAASDPVERVGSRPDFLVLIYPVISLAEPFTHKGSRENLLGENPDPSLVIQMSSQRQVTAQTPPTFLVHGDEDKGVPVENSLAFYAALRKAKVPAELHVFEKGPHGFGLGRPGLPASMWPKLCENWLRSRNLLPGEKADQAK
jgi:acetyl esterase/lipase